MQSLRDLKRRIRSVKNIGQITKAMNVVSMTKMRRAQAIALESRGYALAAFEMFENLHAMSPELPVLLSPRIDTRELLVVITSDKGLAGAFNELIIRRALTWIAEREAAHKDFALIAIGKKGKDALERRGYFPVESYTGFSDFSAIKDTEPFAMRTIEGFVSGEWSGVSVLSTHFRTTLKQETALHKVLPVTEDGLQDIITSTVLDYNRYSEERIIKSEPIKYAYKYIFEPSPEVILNQLVPEILKVYLHHSILESNASEHSARMVAMQAASDNAKELGGELNLEYNKGRQAGITQELSEVVAGQESVGN